MIRYTGWGRLEAATEPYRHRGISRLGSKRAALHKQEARSSMQTDVDAETRRLAALDPAQFNEEWRQYVQRGPSRKGQAEAWRAPQIVGRVLSAAAKARIPLREGESERDHQKRVREFRTRQREALAPLEETIEALALDEIEFLDQLEDAAFAEELAGYVLDRTGRDRPTPRQAQELAFRSFEIAGRAFKAGERMHREPGPFLP